MNRWRLVFRKIRWRVGVRFRSFSLTRENPWLEKYDIGEWTYGDPQVLSWGEGSALTIGRFCSIGGNVLILLGGEHQKSRVSTYPFHAIWGPGCGAGSNVGSKGGISIGHDVWIGTNATVLGGVRIGNGAIVGAQAVVSRPVPAYAIVAGNPARVVGYRFDSGVIAALERIQWWNWPVERIREELPLIASGNVTEFVTRHDPGP